MKRFYENKIFYSVISALVLLIYGISIITMQYFSKGYSQNFNFPVITFSVSIACPLILAVLIFIKSNIHKTISHKFRFILNIILIILFVAFIVLACRPLSAWQFIIENPLAIFLLGFYICSLFQLRQKGKREHRESTGRAQGEHRGRFCVPQLCKKQHQYLRATPIASKQAATPTQAQATKTPQPTAEV